MAFDAVTYAAAKAYTDSTGGAAAKGMEYKGSVATMADLPTSPTKGWLYTITANGHEVVYDGTQWVDLTDDIIKDDTIANNTTWSSNKINIQFNTKITTPSGGVVGNVLKKTSDGVEWGEGSGSSGIFIANYSEASFTDVLNAYNSGKIVLCKYSETILASLSSVTDNKIVFSVLESDGSSPSFYNFVVKIDGEETVWIANTQIFTGDIEDDGRKVSIWSTEPIDDNYPSEKLVKESLDELDLTLKAIYGETSFDDIKNAFTNGKNVYCIVDDDTYPIAFVGSNLAIFENCSIEDGVVKIKRISSDLDEGWKVLDSIELEITNNKVTSITSESTDTQYPTAKAVYNLFNQLQQQINNLSN